MKSGWERDLKECLMKQSLKLRRFVRDRIDVFKYMRLCHEEVHFNLLHMVSKAGNNMKEIQLIRHL